MEENVQNPTEPEGFNMNSRRLNLWKKIKIKIKIKINYQL